MYGVYILTYKVQYTAMSTSGSLTWIYSSPVCELETRKLIQITFYFSVAVLNNVWN